jgi:hypothetical protein
MENVVNAEDYQTGYRAGFAAGREAALREIRESVELSKRAPRKRAPFPDSRRCVCGHADTTHNELGYCQARRDRSNKHSDQCYCTSFGAVAS